MYVDALIDRDKDIIHVVERQDGKRIYRDYPAQYVLYYPDSRGKFESIFGDKLERVVCRSGKDFARQKKLHSGKRLFESDVKPVFRCLADNYLGQDAPKLNIAFFDIETGFDEELGFADPSDPFNPVTAITIHLSQLGKTVCMVMPPPTLSLETAQEICDKYIDCFLFENESDMLEAFLSFIEDSDILTGWNSESFDIPYLVNRITRVMGKEHTRRFCLWNQYPKERYIERYGKDIQIYETFGRVHLDMMQLYIKYTYHEMPSYSLDTIGEYELGDRKVAYDGTLDQLWKNDFNKFIDYAIQDVDLLVSLDAKLQFIDLANAIAHDNTVLLQTTMGAVAVTDQAIINEAHRNGLIVPDNKRDKDDFSAAGAYVAHPVKGFHEWIGSMDLNSLYPSIIRSCNMSTETIIGQIRHIFTTPGIEESIAANPRGGGVAKYWDGKFGCDEYELVIAKDTKQKLYIDFENGETITGTGDELYKFIFDNGEDWILTANGTIFRNDKKGIIPGLLERWYAERKELQKKAKSMKGVDDEQFAFWDKRQLVKKINLNSLYGAILNQGSRFNDLRLGQSTTLTGRCIAKHMAAKTNEIFTDKYDHKGKTIVYGDTDSVYFSAYPIFRDQIEKGEITWDKDTVIELYDNVSDMVNETFADYMRDAHHVLDSEQGSIIAAGREICARSGIFVVKKKYATLVYDNEGHREDQNGKPGKVKAMGLDLKRADTPTYMQDFLNDILRDKLTGEDNDTIVEKIIQFRREFREREPWEMGTPKRVNKLTHYTNLEYDIDKNTGSYNFKKKANMPGHARAAINWNMLRQMNSDKYSMKITDGMKIVVCKLKPNPLNLTSIGYPIDEARLPEWFKELPFDVDEMEETIITKKIENLFGVVDIDLSKAEDKTTFDSLFDFG